MAVARVSTATDGTQGNGSSMLAIVSDDGNLIAFTSTATNLIGDDTNGRQDTFVKNLATGVITRVSTASDGTQANGDSVPLAFSPDGSKIAFTSSATNLVAGDTNGNSDIFVKNLTTGATTRVSTASDGTQANGNSFSDLRFSGDGNTIAFSSNATNLVANDTNNQTDVFVKNLITGAVTRASTAADGTQGDLPSSAASISADGTRVAFQSGATNLVAGDTNNTTDAFVKNLNTGAISRVSIATDGTQGNGFSGTPSLSADGTKVGFVSFATNFVPSDTNSASDIFVRDIGTNTTTRVSTAPDGTQGNGASVGPSLSADGTRIAFESAATNLVAGDTNGVNEIFVKDLTTGGVARPAVAPDGTQNTAATVRPSLSANGSRVAFEGPDGTLVPGDNNSRFDAFAADVVCFATGTLILTSRGDVAVEGLLVGDLAITATGEHRSIRWIGHRTVDCGSHAAPWNILPVRIAAHAFAENRPARDLVVSPGHAICLDVLGEVLIPAAALVNGTTITQPDVETVTYWHVELDSHDILIAEGQPAESYLDMGNRRFFAESGVVDLGATPDADAAARTHADFCRPYHADGVVLDAVRAQVQARAEQRGWRLDDAPWADMHLMVDAVRVEADTHGLSARFVLPASAQEVWLVSETSVPRQISSNPDARQLGLCIQAITIDDGVGEKRSVALDDPRLSLGFHEFEEGVRRWTAGRSQLPAALFDGCRGIVFLRLDMAGPALPRWVAPEAAVVNPAEHEAPHLTLVA